MSDRRDAVFRVAANGIDRRWDLATIIADAVEAGLTWVPQSRCRNNQLRTGKICRMNENHAGSCRSADGDEW